MKIAVTVGLGARSETTIDGLINRAQEIESNGFHGMWLPNAFSFDLAIVGDERALDSHLKRLEEAGATDLQAQLISTGPGTAARTFEYLASRSK